MIPKEGSRDIGDGIIISLAPDVCLTPVGSSTVPVPYSVFAYQSDDANTAATVRMTGKRAHNMGSVVTVTKGDGPGSSGGVVSGTVGAACHPKGHSATVNIQGKPALRHGDEWYMNNKNTVGKLTYVKSGETWEPTPAIILGQNPAQEAPAPILLADAGPNWINFLAPPGTAAPPAAPPLITSPPAPVVTAPPPVSPPPPVEDTNRVARATLFRRILTRLGLAATPEVAAGAAVAAAPLGVGYIGISRASGQHYAATHPGTVLTPFLNIPVQLMEPPPVIVSTRTGTGTVTITEEDRDKKKCERTVVISYLASPKTAQHVIDAQKTGQPSVLTLCRPCAPQNRKASLRGIPTKPGMDRDEYPPATFAEGGFGASVRHVPLSDNRSAGAQLKNQLRGVPELCRITILVK